MNSFMKIMGVLMIGGTIMSCSASGETEEKTTESAAEAVSTYSVGDLCQMASRDEGIDEEFTIKGWFCGMLGSTNVSYKTLYLDDNKGSNNPALEVLLDSESEEKLKDATYDNQITITAKLIESTDFGTHAIAEDCKVLSID